MLADEKVRRAAAGWPEWPAHFTLGIGLQVKGLELARSAEQEHEDHRLRLSSHERRLRLLGREHSRQSHAKQPCPANLQQLAARDAGAVRSGSAVDREHQLRSYGGGTVIFLVP